MKKVSVIIPYRNDRGWLNQAIKSAENQTYGNIEVIVSQGNYNKSINLNKGIEQSTGDFIKYLDEDDVLPPNSIELSLKGFNYPKIKFIHGNAIQFSGGLVSSGYKVEPLIKHVNKHNMLYRNQIHGATLMYKREVFEKYGMFNESLWTAEEYEFNLRLLSKGVKCGYVDEVLAFYRLHSKQKSIGCTDTDYQNERKKVIEEIKNWYYE